MPRLLAVAWPSAAVTSPRPLQRAAMAMAEPADDAQLWAQLLGGDQFAFDGIYDRHAPAVHRVLARRAGPNEAEDLTAAVFEAMWTHRDRIRLADPGGLGPWLMGTATNLARKHHEKHAVRARVVDRVAAELEPEPDHAEYVVSEMAQAADLGLARAAMADLADSDQEILVLCVLEGMRPGEVAEALDVGAATVRSRLHRARARLAQAYQSRARAAIRPGTSPAVDDE